MEDVRLTQLFQYPHNMLLVVVLQVWQLFASEVNEGDRALFPWIVAAKGLFLILSNRIK